MSERIKELAVEAGLKIESLMTNPPKPFQILGSTEQFEKFAELIVMECTKILADNSEFRSCVIIGKHFGVFGVEE
jgi:hypothetical protein